MTGASPETKLDALMSDALEDWKICGKGDSWHRNDYDNYHRMKELRAAIAQNATLAQQAAYERAAQVAKSYDRGDEDTVDAACIAEAIARLAGGSVSALEQVKEVAWKKGLHDGRESVLAHLEDKTFECPCEIQQRITSALELALVQRELKEAEWWADRAGHRGPARPEWLDKSCEMCVRIMSLRARIAALSGQLQEKD